MEIKINKFFKRKVSLPMGKFLLVILLLGFFTAALAAFLIGLVYLSEFNRTITSSEAVSRPIELEVKSQDTATALKQESQITSSVVSFYIKNNSPASIIGQAYITDNMEGNGFILTSDGWIVTTEDVISRGAVSLVAAIGQRVYDIEKALVDPVSNLAFIKINATNLPVSKFGQSEDLESHETIFAATRYGDLAVSFAENPNYYKLSESQDVVSSTEEFNNFILIQDNINTLPKGSPIFNAEGEVVGLAAETLEGGHLAIPTENFENIIGFILKEGQIRRPLLGINYIDISHLVGFHEIEDGFSINNFNFRNLKGAYIYNEPISRALDPDGPARNSDLRPGDLITKVDGLEIDSMHNLTNIIQDYNPGDTVGITAERSGREITVSIELSEFLVGVE